MSLIEMDLELLDTSPIKTGNGVVNPTVETPLLDASLIKTGNGVVDPTLETPFSAVT